MLVGIEGHLGLDTYLESGRTLLDRFFFLFFNHKPAVIVTQRFIAVSDWNIPNIDVIGRSIHCASGASADKVLRAAGVCLVNAQWRHSMRKRVGVACMERVL